jgi:hypothetical protein
MMCGQCELLTATYECPFEACHPHQTLGIAFILGLCSTHNDAHPQSSQAMVDTIKNLGFKIIPCPYSPVFAASDFHMFGPL